jgi:subtilisin family serine protease
VSVSGAQTAVTYRRGRPVVLAKRGDAFVVRAPTAAATTVRLPAGASLEPMSPASTRVVLPSRETRGDWLGARRDQLMDRFRARGIVTHHSYASDRTGAEFLVTDRVFVSFTRSLSKAALDDFAQRYALYLLGAVNAPLTYLFQLTDGTGAGVITDDPRRGVNPLKLVVHFTEREDLVRLADHDLNQRMLRRTETTTDPYFRRQWHLHTRTTDPSFRPVSSARCEPAWRQLGGRGDPEVVVAVTDDGCDLRHRGLDSQAKLAGWAYLDGGRLISEGDPTPMCEGGAEHGTACAALAVAEADGVDVVGAAPGCRLLPVKWDVVGNTLAVSDSKLLTVLDLVGRRADVMSNSWGLAPTQDFAEPVLDRIRALGSRGGRRRKGLVFVWSAGNENCPVNYDGDEALPYTHGWQRDRDANWVWKGASTATYFHNDLADLDEVLIVGAVASDGRRSHYSNFGQGLDLCAPANNAHTYDRMKVAGLDVVTASSARRGVNTGLGGTSSAAPIVAGVAALVISANPALGGAEVIRILKQTASKDLRVTPYPRTPPTEEDPDTSWDCSPNVSGAFRPSGTPEGTWSAWYGYGRVDALAAVRAAQQRMRTPTLTSMQLRRPRQSRLYAPRPRLRER